MIIQISAGQGPAECQLAVAKLYEELKKRIWRNGNPIRIYEGEKFILKSPKSQPKLNASLTIL